MKNNIYKGYRVQNVLVDKNYRGQGIFNKLLSNNNYNKYILSKTKSPANYFSRYARCSSNHTYIGSKVAAPGAATFALLFEAIGISHELSDQ